MTEELFVFCFDDCARFMHKQGYSSSLSFPCKHARNGPVLGRCGQHRHSTGPVLANTGLWSLPSNLVQCYLFGTHGNQHTMFSFSCRISQVCQKGCGCCSRVCLLSVPCYRWLWQYYLYISQAGALQWALDGISWNSLQKHSCWFPCEPK